MEMRVQGLSVYAELLADTEFQKITSVDIPSLTSQQYRLHWREAVSEKHRQT